MCRSAAVDGNLPVHGLRVTVAHPLHSDGVGGAKLAERDAEVLDGVDRREVLRVAVVDDCERAAAGEHDHRRAVVAIVVGVKDVFGAAVVDFDFELVAGIIAMVVAIEVGKPAGDGVSGLGERRGGQ